MEWLIAAVVLLLVSVAAVLLYRWLQAAARRVPPAGTGVSAQGYGDARWARELALWRGTLRRLHVQARHQHPPSEALQRQIAQAEARIAEAERHLAD